MSRPVALALACLSLFLLAFPLTVGKPGLPTNLKADEPAYYLMALSIARDHDLRVEVRDIDRLFEEFPFGPTRNLILTSDDDWHTVHFGKPIAYSLLAAPFAAAWGANGMVLLNMLLFVALIWMGAFYLRRYNDDGLSALAAAGFFLMSTAFAYVFWLQPEVFNMFCVALCLFLAFRPRDGAELVAVDPVRGADLPPSLFAMALSGAALVPAALNKPMFLAVALPVWFTALQARRVKGLASWFLGALLSLALLAGLSLRGTGHALAYFGAERVGAVVCEPGKMPPMAMPSGATIPKPAPAATAAIPTPPAAATVPEQAPAALASKSGPAPTAPTSVAGPTAPAAEAAPAPGVRPTSWSWIFRLPTIIWKELFENVGYFLWGRHTGVLLYLPFAGIAFLLFLIHGARSPARWVLLGSLGLVGLAFLILLPFNWHGGGGFLGNRYFVSVYPAFLFLITRVRPASLLALGFTLGGLFLGSILFTPFGAPVPEGTLQAHVRNPPFTWFPLELSIRQVPGYETQSFGGVKIQGRRDVFQAHGEDWWLRGNSNAEIWMSSAAPIPRAVFRVRSPAPDNAVDVEFAGRRETATFRGGAPGESLLTFTPAAPDRLRSQDGQAVYAYRLRVTPHRGQNAEWTRVFPPDVCPGFAYNARLEDNFFLGAEVLYLGAGEGLDADVFHLEWGAVALPERAAPGARLHIPVELWNRSAVPWNPAGTSSGAASVKLAYHWLRPDGSTAEWDGQRTLLGEVKAGGRATATLTVDVPKESGSYVLALDPLFEHVAWFSERGVPPLAGTVEVANGDRTARAAALP